MTPTEVVPAEVLRVGAVTLDLARQVVSRGNDELHLRPKAFDVLTVLVRNAGHIVSKQRLIEQVWGDVAVTDDSLVQCLVEIRRSVGDDALVIRTVRGRGYVIDAKVERVPAATASVTVADAVEQAPAAAGAPEAPQAGAPSASTPWGRLAAGAAIVAVVVGIGLLAALREGAAPARPAPRDSTVPEARAALQEGLTLLGGSRAQVVIHRSRELFEQALARDDGYAAAHAALGNALVLLATFGVEPARAVLPRALAEAGRAVALDPTLAEGWQALAHAQTQTWDWPAAEDSYRRAIALDPTAQPNMIFAHLLVGIGRAEEALAESDRLLAFDAGSAWRQGSNCVVKYLARRFEAALAACDRGLAIDANQSLAHFWRAHALTALNRHDEALEAALRSRRDMGFAPTWLVGYVHAKAGRQDDAREVLRAIEARAATDYVPAVEIAFLHAALGDRTAALDWLERAYDAQGPWVELLGVHPAADDLRAEPRFQALLERLRLPVVR